MNDFDFEELDKAVSALATKTDNGQEGTAPTVPALAQPRPNVPAASRSAAPTSVPARTQPDEPIVVKTAAPQPAEPSAPKPSAPLAKHRLDESPRKRGAFMDIVTPPRKPGTRVGTTLQPVSKPEDIVPEEPKAPEPEPKLTDTVPLEALSAPELPADEPQEASKSQPEPASEVAAAPAEASPAAESQTKQDVTWPDPLDFHDDEPKKDEPKEDDTPAEASSPFLREAKVEKRPLGAFSTFQPEAEKPVEPEPPKPEQPIEEPAAAADKPASEPKEPKAPLADLHKKEAPEEAPEPPAKNDMHSAAMMSIPQQYRTEAKETDKAKRPIFDTKEYHPPLLEAAVHDHRGGGSMWGKLFIALVVLALLGVGGYFVYLYVVGQ